jgi:hypothetical protein
LIYETDIIKLSTLRKIKHPVIKQQQPQQQQYQQQQQSGLIPHYSNLLHEVSLSNKEKKYLKSGDR